MQIIRILTLTFCAFSAVYAQAACTNPAGVEGDVVYNTTAKVVQFCDGTTWFSTAQTAECNDLIGSSGNCVNPTADEGSIVYNSSDKVMQFCNGTSWMQTGGVYNCPPPSGRYWRLRTTSVGKTSTGTDASGNSIGELNFRINGTQTSLSGYTFTNIGGAFSEPTWGIAKQYDGNTSTMTYVAGSNMDFYVDLTTSTAVESFMIAPHYSINHLPYNFEIYYSNDSTNWTLAKTFTNTTHGDWTAHTYREFLTGS